MCRTARSLTRRYVAKYHMLKRNVLNRRAKPAQARTIPRPTRTTPPSRPAQKGKPQCKAAIGNAPGEQKRGDKTPRRTAFRRTHGRPRNFPFHPLNFPSHPHNSPRRPHNPPSRPRKRSVFGCVPLYYIIWESPPPAAAVQAPVSRPVLCARPPGFRPVCFFAAPHASCRRILPPFAFARPRMGLF